METSICVPRLEPIPVAGPATARDVAHLAPHRRRWPGRQHPRAGLWLWERYAGPGVPCADPMAGARALWSLVPADQLVLYSGDIQDRPWRAAPRNSAARRWDGHYRRDARRWAPERDVELCMFSPEFGRQHSSGASAHQREIRDAKRTHAVQDWADVRGRLTPVDGPGRAAFWEGMRAVYARILTYARRCVVVLKNFARGGHEVDENRLHVEAMAEVGWRIVGAHPRDMGKPSMYVQWSLARGKVATWVREEMTIVAERPTAVAVDDTLHVVPVTFRVACDFVARHHRHNKPPRGMKFCIGLRSGERLVGVAIAGRPVARALDDGRTLEVNRTCTDGARNANSMLYGAVWRAAKAMGYARCVTYTQEAETGASLRAVGWRVAEHLAPRGNWADSSGGASAVRRDPDGPGGVARVRWEIEAGR